MAATIDAAAAPESHRGHYRARVPGILAYRQDPHRATTPEWRGAREYARGGGEPDSRHHIALLGRRNNDRAVDDVGSYGPAISRDHARSVVRASRHEAQHVRAAVAEAVAQVRSHRAPVA